MSLPTFTFSSTADEVAAALAQEIAGKNVLVTGTSIGGIGFETAKAIAKYANLTIITGYNAERLKLTEEAIKKELPSANVRCLTLDLLSLAAVRKAAAEVNAYSEPIHVLINNAAGGSLTFALSPDGFESQMTADHFGPFLFTALLAPKLLAVGTASYVPRVVFVSSGAHSKGPGINLATLRAPDTNKNGHLMYHEAKCANVMTASELSRRAQGKIHAYSLHPGVIFTKAMQIDEVVPMLKSGGILKDDGQPNPDYTQWKTIPQGAATTVTAAFDPRLNDKPGIYLDNSNDANVNVAPHCLAVARCEELWTITEELVGVKFTV